MHDNAAERQRLKQLYAGLGDAELLGLLRQRSELTLAAQQALDTEAASRHLELTPDDEAEPDAAAAEHSLEEAGVLRLARFNMASDAGTAATALEEAGIPCRIARARGRETEDGPEVDLPGLDVFIQAADQSAAEAVLRRVMKLFPLPEVDRTESDPDGEPFYVVGTFPTAEEAQGLQDALTTAGITSTRGQDEDDDGPFWTVEVSFDDLEPAHKIAG